MKHNPSPLKAIQFVQTFVLNLLAAGDEDSDLLDGEKSSLWALKEAQHGETEVI